MSLLKEYWDKRRFDLTPEPRGQVVTGSDEPIFVVQKHQASRLHYDLRLEIDGVLYSWAVPQGPSLDTKVKRFARQTEHHPLEYAGFEGVIPDNQYGGGSMIVWDKGDWAPIADDPVQAMADGELKFRLAGERLSGGFTLVRLPEDPLNWLLIKERDPSAKPEAELNVTETYQTSILTGRSIEELAPEEADAPIDLAEIKGVKPADFPKKFKPQLATKGPVPLGEDWVHEIKFDGYRTLVFVDHGTVRLITRNGLDWTERYGHLAKAFNALPCETAILDGETVVQNARGVSVLSQLERALSDNRTHELTYFAFDLVHLDGYDLTGAALLERKAALKQLVAPVITANSPIQFSDHTQTHGP
ncbi:MAG: DNA polymerase ligase N-terminal domain-containing protein, partial [Pseudomonadota bacterium]